MVEPACQCRGRSWDSWSRKIPDTTGQLSTMRHQLLTRCAAATEAPLPRAGALQREASTMRSPHSGMKGNEDLSTIAKK